MTVVKTQTGSVYTFHNGRIIRDVDHNPYGIIDAIYDWPCIRTLRNVEVGKQMFIRVDGGIVLTTSPILEITHE